MALGLMIVTGLSLPPAFLFSEPPALPPGDTTSTVDGFKFSEERNPNGSLRARGLLKLMPDGEWARHGMWSNYWASGSLSVCGEYEEGEKVGPWCYWHESGNFMMTNQFRAVSRRVVPPPPKPRVPMPAVAASPTTTNIPAATVTNRAVAGVSFRCREMIAAYDPKAPANLLGCFDAGSELEVARTVQPDGLVPAKYRGSDGKTVDALCVAEDVGLKGKGDVRMRLGFGRSALFKQIEHSLEDSSAQKCSRPQLQRLMLSRCVLVYFSAHWCGPCRQFTPKLVEMYNEISKTPFRNAFEVIFVSSDRSAAEQAQYMQSMSMPWLAVTHDQAESGPLAAFGGNGIPCLVMLDEKGEVLSHSYVGGQYVGPGKVLRDFAARLDALPVSQPGTGAGEKTPAAQPTGQPKVQENSDPAPAAVKRSNRPKPAPDHLPEFIADVTGWVIGAIVVIAIIVGVTRKKSK